jgi:hypothetical protein
MGGPVELLYHRAGSNCFIQRKVIYVECEKDPNRMVRQQEGGNEKVTDLKNGADFISTHFPGMIRGAKCTLDWTDKRRTCLPQWCCTELTNDNPSNKPTGVDERRLLESSCNMRAFLARKEIRGSAKQVKEDAKQAKHDKARAKWEAAELLKQQGGSASCAQRPSCMLG